MGETLQTERKLEEQSEALAALCGTYRDAEPDGSIGAAAALDRAYQRAEQSLAAYRERQEQSLSAFGRAWEDEQVARAESATATSNRMYKEAEQNREQRLAALTAIAPARGVKLGDLLASPVLDNVRDTMKASVLDVTEHIRQQMIAPLNEIPRLILGESAIESFKFTLGIADSVIDMGAWEDAAKSLRSASGIADSISAVSAWQNSMVAPALGIAESFRMLDTWQDSLASFADAQREREQAMLSSFARAHASEQADLSRRMGEQLTRYSDMVRDEQQRRAERMRSLYDTMQERWQFSPGAAPRHWRVYEPEPEPPAEQVEVVHLLNVDWREILTAMIHEGKVSPVELEKFARQHKGRAPGLIPPDWAEIEAVALAYKESGHRYESQEAFVMHFQMKFPGLSLSLATFKRWINQYEMVTGECVRPGRGRRKRKLPKRRSM